jgi:hypothetical protein
MNDVENAANEMEGAAKKAASEVKSAFEAYQEKLMEIAKENMAFAAEFGQAITGIRSSTDFMNVTNEFTQRRLDMFQRHTSELMAISTPRF